MLVIKNLSKVYRPKKGVPVKALDNISLTFPETGMVFLLGKSGSGKSTLLNLLGGLDKYDDGEIVINGMSSKSFKQSHFDSYRNTYVGFIFQEYNVLDEFTVGANIALAIELQGRKAGDSEIDDILRRVDLEGYGARRPGELSGGQKQRVAIARALVKNPQIIMADEPTGALDSATGKQVFDTLKKLSSEKLVIVVSHDREFAEKYADRIIELSDGHVISDVERDAEAVSDISDTEQSPVYEDGTVTVPSGYHLTEQDREDINRYIDSLSDGGVFIKASSRKNRFKATDTERAARATSNKTFEPIKSRLPAKCALKIGASGLKHKKIRLVITILLSCISFGLFGLSDTFGAYDHITACTNSIVDSEINYLSVSKKINIGDEGIERWIDQGTKLDEKDLDEVKKRCGTDVVGVYSPKFGDLSINNNTDMDAIINASQSDYNIYTAYFSGFAEIDAEVLRQMNYELSSGDLPSGDRNEIAISDHILETFKLAGYKGAGDEKTQKINTASDIIGKTLVINEKEYTVCGVVKTNTDISRYKGLMDDQTKLSQAQILINYALGNEFNSMVNYSFAAVAMVGKGGIEKMASEEPQIRYINNGWIYFHDSDYNWIDAAYMATLDGVNKDHIVWFGEEKTELGEKELIVSSDLLRYADYADMEEAGTKTFTAYETIPKTDSKYDSDDYEDDGYKIVGYYDNETYSDLNYTLICNKSLAEKHSVGTDGAYSFAIGAMPGDKDGVREVVKGCYYNTDKGISFKLKNSATYELDTVNGILGTVSTVFFWIGVGFALFAALMLANFIATSISYKKQEIGILRAIGSSGSDVFRIFFSESLIIALINFVLSCIGVGTATAILNYLIRTKGGVLVTVLNFGIRQTALLLVLSVVIAALASFIPVKKIASKKPIDAIRNR